MAVNDTGMTKVGGFLVVTSPYIPKGHIAFMAPDKPGLWQLVTPEGELKFIATPDPVSPLQMVHCGELLSGGMKPFKHLAGEDYGESSMEAAVTFGIDMANKLDNDKHIPFGDWLDKELGDIAHVFAKPGVMGPSCNPGPGWGGLGSKDLHDLTPDECLDGVASLLK